MNFSMELQLIATSAMIHANGRNKLGKGYLKEMGQRIVSYKTAISALTQQLNNGWIPVSERLPNTGETVLLTVPVNRGISHGYGSVDIAWICDKENKCFYGTDGKYSYDEAIAWQPLPPKYKEVSDAERN